MSSFWISYIDLVALLLNLIRAIREADWNLYLAALGRLIHGVLPKTVPTMLGIFLATYHRC